MDQTSLGLLCPLPPLTRSWWRFWRLHPALLPAAEMLLSEFPIAPGLVLRLAHYVSEGIVIVDRRGRTTPLLFAGFASGLEAYQTTRKKRGRAVAPRVVSGETEVYRAFVNATLAGVAAHLSRVAISSHDALWTVTAGAPLRPWLEARGGQGFRLYVRDGDQRTEARTRQAIEQAIFSGPDRDVLRIRDQ